MVDHPAMDKGSSTPTEPVSLTRQGNLLNTFTITPGICMFFVSQIGRRENAGCRSSLADGTLEFFDLYGNYWLDQTNAAVL